MNNCEHRWKTLKFLDNIGECEYEYTHYMKCIKCGAYKTIMYQEKPQDKSKTE